jgi:8-oxo-dGTP pyrophosphatase MutT (NUDIX family)
VLLQSILIGGNPCAVSEHLGLTYDDYAEKLSRALRPVTDEQGANAAVALLLKPEKQDLNVLFVRRVENLADPWSGQIAFPGGKRDPKDTNLMETVVRETLEETGINILKRCHFLGVLTALSSRPRPELRILPFVILLEYEPLIKLSEKELQEFMWISLGEIAKHRGSARLSFGEAPAFIIGNVVIWGLTYRILEDLLDISRALSV